MTVGEVARVARVSVRTLHHYDAIGLVSPSRRSTGGYRVYTDEDLATLQQVLFYRELGMPLAEIARVVHDPAFDRHAALLAQRDALRRRIGRLGAIVALIETTLAHEEGALRMTKEDMFEAFGDFDASAYEDEVRERWGDSDAYREAARRTSRYTKDDWSRFRAEQDALNARVAALLDAGVPADDPRALEAVEGLRLAIDRWFYTCSRAMHAQLGEMYVADPRFAATYEAIRPGLARYLRDATAANAAR